MAREKMYTMCVGRCVNHHIIHDTVKYLIECDRNRCCACAEMSKINGENE